MSIDNRRGFDSADVDAVMVQPIAWVESRQPLELVCLWHSSTALVDRVQLGSSLGTPFCSPAACAKASCFPEAARLASEACDQCRTPVVDCGVMGTRAAAVHHAAFRDNLLSLAQVI